MLLLQCVYGICLEEDLGRMPAPIYRESQEGRIRPDKPPCLNEWGVGSMLSWISNSVSLCVLPNAARFYYHGSHGVCVCVCVCVLACTHVC